MQADEDRSCKLCGAPGRKIRVQVFPWRYQCLYVCQPCMPEVTALITELRDDPAP